MSVVTAKVAEVTVTIDGKPYGAQILGLVLTAESNASSSDRKTLSGETVPEVGTYTDTLTGTVVQDWPAPGGGLIGMSRTPANRGKVVPFVITTVEPAGYSATGTVQVQPLDLGLDPNETAESDMSWKIISLVETYPNATP